MRCLRGGYQRIFMPLCINVKSDCADEGRLKQLRKYPGGIIIHNRSVRFISALVPAGDIRRREIIARPGGIIQYVLATIENNAILIIGELCRPQQIHNDRFVQYCCFTDSIGTGQVGNQRF